MPRGLIALGAAAALIGAATPLPQRNAQVFDAAWRAVADHYWDPAYRGVDWQAARARFRPQAIAAPNEATFYRVLNAMLSQLHDSHVFAMPPAEVRYEAARARGQEQASFGFGAYEEDGGWLVYTVRAGSPAAAAGVRPGWRILAIDGGPVDVDRHPAPGERATIRFEDETGRPRTLTLTAEPSPPDPDVHAVRMADGLLLIQLDGFSDEDAAQVRTLLRTDPPPAGVILDLRENDGGEEEAAARIAGLFFADKETLLRRTDRRKTENVPTEWQGRRSYRGPVAVLVGPRSASAAEALAALLSESGRAISLGARTAGALTGASLIDLPDGGQLSLADFDVRTAAGRRIEGRGFEPERPIPISRADMAAGRDPVLAAAVAALAPARLAGRSPPAAP